MRPYVFSSGAVAAFLILGLLLHAFLDPHHTPFLLLLAPVLLAAHYWRLGPGLLATTLSSAAGVYFFIPPFGSFDIPHSAAAVRLMVFGGLAASTAWLIELRHRGAQRERERARELARDTERTRRILESITGGFVELDRDGRCRSLNRQAEDFCGRSREELLGGQIWESASGGNRSELAQRFHRAIAENQPVRFEVESPGHPGVWAEMHLFPTPDGVFVHFRDITERKRFEVERERLLRDHEQHHEVLDRLMEYVPAGIVLVDATGSIRRISRYGMRAAQGAAIAADAGSLFEDGQQWKLYRPGEDAPLATEELPLFRALRHGEVIDGEEFEMRLDGQGPIVLVSAGPIRDGEGRPVGAIAVWRDITDRRRMEDELRRSNEDLRQFAFAVSHDLKEPLRTVSRCVTALRELDREPIAAGAECVGEVEAAVERMQAMINDLLAYSQVLHPSAMSPGPVDLNQALEWARSNLETSMRETGAQVTHEALPVIRGDFARLVQLFQNLLSNSLKYRSAEPPRIHVGVERSGDEWRIHLQDNGIGFDPKYADRVFGVFKRLHGAEYPGTGLGLAICRRIVEQHRGRIWVESSPGQGSRFCFTLPAVEPLPDTP